MDLLSIVNCLRDNKKTGPEQEVCMNQLYGYILPICESEVRKWKAQLSEDDIISIFNDTFVKAAREKLDALKDPKSFKAWFGRMFRNAIIDFYRRGKPGRQTLDLLEASKEVPLEDPDALKAIIMKEGNEFLKTQLDELDARCQDLIYYRFWLEYTFKEIYEKSEGFNNLQTVHNHFKRCLENLRAKLL